LPAQRLASLSQRSADASPFSTRYCLPSAHATHRATSASTLAGSFFAWAGAMKHAANAVIRSNGYRLTIVEVTSVHGITSVKHYFLAPARWLG
jgi:hypothetical protein